MRDPLVQSCGSRGASAAGSDEHASTACFGLSEESEFNFWPEVVPEFMVADSSAWKANGDVVGDSSKTQESFNDLFFGCLFVEIGRPANERSKDAPNRNTLKRSVDIGDVLQNRLPPVRDTIQSDDVGSGLVRKVQKERSVFRRLFNGRVRNWISRHTLPREQGEEFFLTEGASSTPCASSSP